MNTFVLFWSSIAGYNLFTVRETDVVITDIKPG